MTSDDNQWLHPMVEMGGYCYWFQQVDDEGEGRCGQHLSWISRGEKEWKALHHESWDVEWWHYSNFFLNSWVQFFWSVPKSCNNVTFFCLFYPVFFYHANTHLWMIKGLSPSSQWLCKYFADQPRKDLIKFVI